MKNFLLVTALTICIVSISACNDTRTDTVKTTKDDQAKSKQTATTKDPKLEQLNIKATMLFRQGKKAEAITVAEDLIKTAEDKHGKENAGLTPYLIQLGDFYKGAGRLDDAIALYNRAIGILEKKYHIRTCPRTNRLSFPLSFPTLPNGTEPVLPKSFLAA